LGVLGLRGVDLKSGELKGIRAARPVAALQRHAMMLVLLLSSLAASDRAQAACAPTSPVNNATVTCTGTTSGQNGNTGYGSLTDSGNTINVLSGASVTGIDTGVQLHDGTVNNAGTISVTNFSGVVAVTDLTVNNSGKIFGGTGAFAVAAGGILNLTNSGTLIATTNQPAITAFTANVFNSGTVSGGTRAISANNINLTNSGVMSGSDSVIFGVDVR